MSAIKKYLAANYKVDPIKLAPFIRKFLKAAVANKTIVQTKGTGASGYFKLVVLEAKSEKRAASNKKLGKAKAPPTPKKKSVTKKTAPEEPAAKKMKKSAATPKPKTAPKPKKTPEIPVAAPKAKKNSY